jgi:hypothetical protein
VPVTNPLANLTVSSSVPHKIDLNVEEKLERFSMLYDAKGRNTDAVYFLKASRSGYNIRVTAVDIPLSLFIERAVWISSPCESEDPSSGWTCPPEHRGNTSGHATQAV